MGRRNAYSRRIARHGRVRRKVAGTQARPRLAVFRSLKHIYAQVIDDVRGATLVSAASDEAQVRASVEGKNKSDVSVIVGSLLAQRAAEQGVEQVVFDRGGYRYHGRVKALADAARKGGLAF